MAVRMVSLALFRLNASSSSTRRLLLGKRDASRRLANSGRGGGGFPFLNGLSGDQVLLLRSFSSKRPRTSKGTWSSTGVNTTSNETNGDNKDLKVDTSSFTAGDQQQPTPPPQPQVLPIDDDQQQQQLNPVYVHPLSQIVLRHFQTACHHWICSKSLDKTLVIHRDGTFVLQQGSSSSNTPLRIWTYYDGEDRKHWLSVSMDQIQHRFLLQDNLMSAWRGYKRNSLSERVQESVQDLMDAVDEAEF